MTINGTKIILGSGDFREYIAVFREPSSFKVNISVPIEEAKQIKTVRGKFKEATYAYNSFYYYTVEGIKECER